jgi:hypothetical protein
MHAFENRRRASRTSVSGTTVGVEAGQVVCPSRGVIDVETCFACGRFRGMTGARGSGLVCAGRGASWIGLSVFGVLVHQEV